MQNDGKLKIVSWNVNGLRAICRKFDTLEKLLTHFDAGDDNDRRSIAIVFGRSPLFTRNEAHQERTNGRTGHLGELVTLRRTHVLF